jgi:hypothetical protein
VPSLLAERARSECARSMRAVEGNLGHPLQDRERGIGGKEWGLAIPSARATRGRPSTQLGTLSLSKGRLPLARANGTSRHASGWAGEKVTRSGRSISPHPRRGNE